MANEDELTEVEEDFPVNIESPGLETMALDTRMAFIMIGLGLIIAAYTWWSL